MRVSPRIQLRPSRPGTPPPGSLRTSHISIVFLERGSSAHTGAGCAAIHLTSKELESKRKTVPPLDAPKSHSYVELQDGFSVFAEPLFGAFGTATAAPSRAFRGMIPGCLPGSGFSHREGRFQLKKTP